MSKREFLKSNLFFVLLTLLIAFLLVVIMYIGVFRWLAYYTQHGEELVVPDICGMYTEEAEIILAERGLKVEIIDSTYNTEAPLGTIIEQNPPLGSKVKNGRSVYVITNAKMLRRSPLPDLTDLSVRQAVATLHSIGLVVIDTIYEPSEYRDLILDIRSDSINSIEPGTRLTEGTEVVIVVGQGKGTEQVYIPILKGRTYEQARETLCGARLVVGAIDYLEEKPEVASDDTIKTVYYVYQQTPNGGQWILEGSRIDITLTADSVKAQEAIATQDEEEFF